MTMIAAGHLRYADRVNNVGILSIFPRRDFADYLIVEFTQDPGCIEWETDPADGIAQGWQRMGHPRHRVVHRDTLIPVSYVAPRRGS